MTKITITSHAVDMDELKSDIVEIIRRRSRAYMTNYHNAIRNSDKTHYFTKAVECDAIARIIDDMEINSAGN